MRTLRSNEVFKPGAFPEHTYISRVSPEFSYTYEFRLSQALNTTGFLTSVIGPSKTGKTVLCEKVIEWDRIVSLSGSDFKNSQSFWTTVANKAGLSIEGEQTQISSIAGERVAGVTESKASSVKEKFLTGKDQVIEYFKENKLVLILDDFHYAPNELQLEIAQQLKDAIRKEFTSIVISLPHRADDAIRKNPDLSGRLSLINIEPWQTDALEKIAVTGFNALGVKVNPSLVEVLAAESLTSPQLMQSICLNLCLLLDIDNDAKIKEITEQNDLINAFKATTTNLPYKDVVKRLRSGPYTRGQKRKTFTLSDGTKSDIYDLLLKAIALDPPTTFIRLDELKERFDQILGDTPSKPDRNKIKSTIEQTQTIINTNGSIYQVFEWKDDVLYILEPLFLFYLRWGTHN
ncbi:AAA family ATPase [Paenibacillus qinlingensis]|uniref:AAA family ATPase n=1 Tax=Paenibacillus qinlingensis TaxID=1837343 RepID=UPI00156539AA|nr:AAA family ATPase [Paenibacillus qinlingensis]NQX63742.1 ATP-binding protein [Paenibacillus qinlingensis]